MNDIKRLYKSRTDRMIDGVCGGIAEYFSLDPTLMRIAWVLLTLLGGSGILLYIIAMIVMPVGPAPAQAPTTVSHSNHRFWGILLVIVGGVWLMANLGFSLWHHWWDASWEVVLPLILILAGVAFLFGGRNYVASSAQASEPGTPLEPVPEPSSQQTRRLFRSRSDRKLFGVCGGLGAYFAIDPTIVRILFVVSAFASFGLMLFLYFVMAIVVPEEHPVPSTS